MANHKSAKKRIRRNDKFQLINKIRKTRVRTFIKKVESFIEKKDKKWENLSKSHKAKEIIMLDEIIAIYAIGFAGTWSLITDDSQK